MKFLEYIPFSTPTLGTVFLLIILPLLTSTFDPLTVPGEWISLEIGGFELFEGFNKVFSAFFSPSPILRNCCLFLALIDTDFFVSSLLDDADDWGCDGGAHEDGNCSVMGLDPIHGSFVLEEKELLADEEEEGDGVVGKELLTDTIPESTEYLSLLWADSSGVSINPVREFNVDGDNMSCIWSTLLDLGFGEGSIEPNGASFMPEPEDVLLLPLPILLFPLFNIRFRWL